MLRRDFFTGRTASGATTSLSTSEETSPPPTMTVSGRRMKCSKNQKTRSRRYVCAYAIHDPNGFCVFIQHCPGWLTYTYKNSNYRISMYFSISASIESSKSS
jgi:hypothetical protein